MNEYVHRAGIDSTYAKQASKKPGLMGPIGDAPEAATKGVCTTRRAASWCFPLLRHAVPVNRRMIRQEPVAFYLLYVAKLQSTHKQKKKAHGMPDETEHAVKPSGVHRGKVTARDVRTRRCTRHAFFEVQVSDVKVASRPGSTLMLARS